jgi:hypothetical protein
MSATVLSGRDRAILRAVLKGRAELVAGRTPELLIDGRWCCDQTAAHALCAAGLIAAIRPATTGVRVRCALSRPGFAALAAVPSETPRPGGMSLASLRRVGSPNTHHASGEDPMLTTTNPDCLALDHDWDWGVEPCPCGRPHTFRICARCLIVDDPACDATETTGITDGSEVLI